MIWTGFMKLSRKTRCSPNTPVVWGNDWTPVRALCAHIKGTNGQSQGVVPFLKVVNDTAVAVNQGGKRKGAVCAYLESWHLDIEEFLELRKNTGDDRRRTHDMNTANWIPDLFMKRVMENGEWTLFSPSDCPDLHDKVGREFEKAYTAYEEKAARSEHKLFRKIPALQLWRKMLSMLFETGHPWITFKDPCNIRSPQSHVGVVHSSNLCTEITLNTNEHEIAVCNLGSVNLVAHLKLIDGTVKLDHAKLQRTIATAMRMLDTVIDINYFAVGPRHPAAGHAGAAARRARRPCRNRHERQHGLGRLARAHQAARHAQFQLPGHRADRHHRQHHRCIGFDRAHLSEPVREVEPVGRIHRGQRIPGERPQAPGLVGRSDDLRSQVFRRQLGQDRPGAGRVAEPLRHRVRSRAAVAGGGGRAAAKVDRPIAVAQYLYGRRLGQAAGRYLQARLEARSENDLLPAFHGRNPCGEIHGEGRAAERRARGRDALRGQERGSGRTEVLLD